MSRRRILLLAITVLLVTPAISLAQSAVLPGVADARCAGVGNGIGSTLEPSGLWVSEAPVTGTCNNNGNYQAMFRSHVEGWRASVWIQNNGEWQGFYGGYNTNLYGYSYLDHNTTSLIHFCLDNGPTYWCGWGTSATDSFTHEIRGTNTGF